MVPERRRAFLKERKPHDGGRGPNEADLRSEHPRALFETDLPERVPGDPSRYAVTSDGRFLVTAPAPDAENEDEPQIHVIVNWVETLRDRAPKP